MVDLGALPVDVLEAIAGAGREEAGEARSMALDRNGRLDWHEWQAARDAQRLKLTMLAVNRHWHDAIHRSLYRTVLLQSAEAMLDLSDNLHADAQLASLVQSVVVYADAKHYWDIDEAKLALVDFLGSGLTSLRAVTIGGDVAKLFARGGHRFLLLPLPPSVRAFTADLSPLVLEPQSAAQLSDMGITFSYHPYGGVPDATALACNRLLATSFANLVSLELIVPSGYRGVSLDRLWTNAPRLTALRIVNVHDEELRPLFATFSASSAPASPALPLRLSIEGLSDINLAFALKSLPEGIETLQLSARPGWLWSLMHVSEAATSLREGRLASLKRLILDRWERPAAEGDSALRSACAHRNIVAEFVWAFEGARAMPLLG